MKLFLKVDTLGTLDVSKITESSLLFQTDFSRLVFW